MKICRITRRPLLSVTQEIGPDRFANLAQILQARGHEINELEIRPRSLGNPYLGYSLGMMAIPKRFRSLKPDLVLADKIESGALAVVLKELFRVPLVFDFVDDYALIASLERHRARSSIVASLERFLPRFADTVIVVTREMESFCRDNGVSARRLKWIPNGVDCQLFTPQPIERGPVTDLIGKTGQTILFRGKMSRYMQLPKLLEALRIVLDSLPEATMVMVGDGPDRADLEELARSLKIGHAVEFVGRMPREELARIIGVADLCVYPLPVPTALAVMEYSACAKPTLIPTGGTRKLGMRHPLVEEGCLLVADDSAEGFAGAIIRALRNPKAAQELGARARATVREHFDWNSLADDYEQALKSVCRLS